MPVSPRALALALLLLGGCVQPYEPPTVNQPHAVIKVRRTYETTAGVQLRESADIDENVALRRSNRASVAKAPLTDSFLAHPIPATYRVENMFFHQELRTFQESYQVPTTTYRMESYSCGGGVGKYATHRTCTRSVPHTTYTTRFRTVTRMVDISDGSCALQLRFAPRANHVYLLQYTYQAPSVCRLQCVEQVRAPDGGFENRPCPPAPAE